LKHDGAKDSPLEPASILLVDDDPANMLALKALLGDLGQNLFEARSGEEALQRFIDEDFAVVLLDVQMPGLDGFETARRIRLGENSGHTPIIFLTAYDDDRFPVEKAYSLGAVDYLVKPLVPAILRAKVRSFVEIHQEKERAKREADQLRLLIHGTTEYAIFMLDSAGRITTWNPGAERLNGYQADEIIGQHFSRFYPQEAIDRRWPDYELEVARDKGRFEDEGWRVRKDGTQFWSNVVITALRDEAGNLRGFSKITRDMTERKQAEENARLLVREETARRAAEEQAQIVHEERERLRVTLASIGDAVISTGADCRIEFLNPIAEQLTGWTTSEASDRPLDEVFRIINELTRQPVENPAQIALREGRTIGLTNHSILMARDGMERPIDDSAAPIRDAMGATIGAVLTFRDISERIKLETRRNVRLAVTQILAQTTTVKEAAQKILETVCKGLGWDIGALWLHDIEVGALRCLELWHPPDKPASQFVKLSREYLFKRGEGLPGRIWASGKPSWIQDVVNDMNFPRAAAAAAAGVHGAFGCPLLVGTQMLGVIEFFSHEIREPDDDLLEMMDTLAGQIGQFIERIQAYAELRESDRRKDEFLATLAHELRNPLAPIRNALQILKMSRVDAATGQQVREVMERQVDQLVRLVDDLLDVSRVMRGKIELRREQVELASVIARGVETAMPLIEVQGHEVSVAVPPDSLILDADPVRLAQVIGNLLTNAAKYTEANGRIWLSVERDDGHVSLHIRDNGIGIAPDMLPHVFDLFVQLDEAATRSQGGLGIGLTLVKNLIEMHSGTVEAKSAGLGKGSEFIVRLPLSSVERPIESGDDGDRQQQKGSSSGHRLLVVDDNEDAANSLALLLRLKGHHVEVAHHGPAALEIAQNYRPDMIFLDIGMPGMDGYEVARRLRQHPDLKDVVLAALTGWGQQEDRRRSAEAGFDHHLVKPPEPKVVESLLGDLGQRKA
jgi:PAS domain S-box-containing protein